MTPDTCAEGAARCGQDFSHRAGLDHLARVEYHDAVGEGEGVDQVMGDQQRCPPVRGENLAQHRAHRCRTRHVQPGQRLVEKQHLRLSSQGTSERHPLGLTAGKFTRLAVGETLGANLGQPTPRAAACR